MQPALTIGHSPKALFLELQHLVREAHPLLTYDVLTWHPNIFEEHLCCVRGPHAQFINFSGNMDSCNRSAAPE